MLNSQAHILEADYAKVALKEEKGKGREEGTREWRE